jgi:polyprenyl-phospho-N-acetylgalactosaminyl synthase
MAADNRDVWVVIPVFNEEKVIAGVVTDVLAAFPNVVCVDDGSSDRSVDEVLSTRAHLVCHPVNLGQGAALQTGLRYALDRPGSRFFVTFDADGQHRVADAAAMVELARSETADVVLGSRFLTSAHTVPPLKRVILRVVTALSPTARKLRLTDSHNGLRVFNRPTAEALHITHDGMAHASEIVTWLAHSGRRVVEAPVTVDYTEYSRSKGQSLINGVNILFDLSLGGRRK